MRILLWHGYLLGGTGSNVYTRQLAREWSRAGSRRHRPEPGAAAGDVRPRRRRNGPPRRGRASCRCSCSTGTRDTTTCGASRTAREPSSSEWVEANAAAVRQLLPADLVFTNHVLLGGPVGAASEAPFAVKAHGSELEYSMRGRPDLASWGAEALAEARATFVGSEHIRDGRRGRLRPRPSVSSRCRRASTSSCGCPRSAARRSRQLARRGGARPAEPRQRRRAAPGRRERRTARRVPRRRPAHRRLLRQADRAEGRRRPPRGAPRHRCARGDRRVRARAAGARSAGGVERRPGALHRAARAPPPAAPARARRRVRRAVRLPRGVRHGRRRGGGGRLPARRRAPLGSRGGRGRARGGAPAASLRRWSRSRPATRKRSASGSRRCSPWQRTTVQLLRATVRRVVEERWSWAGIAQRLLEVAEMEGQRG